jgi:hypothetical protein
MRFSSPPESARTFFAERLKRTASFSKSLRPSSIDSARCCSATAWRTRLRAREVLTKLSQSREGLAFGEVSISTTSPFWIAVRSGTIRPLMRDPVHLFPTSV